MSKKPWRESPWLIAAFVVFASPVAVLLLDDWATVKKAFGVLLVVLVLAGAGRLLVVSRRDDIRKREAHEENLARIREERATAREERAKEQRVEDRWEKAAEQLWSDESRELIVAAAKLSIEDPAFGEAAVKLSRYLSGIFGDYFGSASVD